MKKTLFFFLAFIILAVQLNANIPGSVPSEVSKYYIGHGVEVTFEQLIKLTPKEYKKLTGHRLGFVKSIAIKTIQKKISKAEEGSGNKSQLVALLLVLFVGVLGIHRFYLGYTWQGVVQLLTAGGFGIWALIDLIRIITGDLKPKNGEYKTKL